MTLLEIKVSLARNPLLKDLGKKTTKRRERLEEPSGRTAQDLGSSATHKTDTTELLWSTGLQLYFPFLYTGGKILLA